MDELHIVIYRPLPGGRWRGISEGEFPERQLAENFIECKRSTGWSSYQFAIVDGQIVPVPTREEIDAAMGAF